MALNADRSVAVTRWKGVDLREGNNVIKVVVSNADGSRAKAITREIFYAGPAIRGEIVEELSTLVADGKTRPLIAVRLVATALDDRRVQVPLAATESMRRTDPEWEVENDRKNDLVTVGSRGQPIASVTTALPTSNWNRPRSRAKRR